MLGALGSLASAEQSNTKVSRADHGAIRSSSMAIAPSLVSPDQGLSIIGAALESRKPTDSNADCSNLVHAIYERAGLTYPYANSSELYRGVKEFQRILDPQPGDLVVWRGHVGIVISPVQHSFFSAMRSGRGVEFYDSPYWQARGRPRFFRYLRVDSRTQFSASTRNTPASGFSSARQTTDKRSPVPNGDKHISGTRQSATVATAGVSRADWQAVSSETKGSQAALPDKSESQTTSDAKSALDANKPTRASHKMQGPEDGVWVKSDTKPSPEIPFDSAVTSRRANQPQGFRASNIPAPGHPSARSSSAGGPLASEVKPESVQWAMSREVPRPPWSSRNGGTLEPSVPRPPAKPIPHSSSAY
jgi:NlpC/P60 family